MLRSGDFCVYDDDDDDDRMITLPLEHACRVIILLYACIHHDNQEYCTCKQVLREYKAQKSNSFCGPDSCDSNLARQ